jgi:Peptidase family M28
VIYNSFTSLDALIDYIGEADVKGKAITASQPVVQELLNRNLDSIKSTWKAKGLVAIVWFGDRVVRSIDNTKQFAFLPRYRNEFLDAYFNSGGSNSNAMPEIGLTPARMIDLLKADGIGIKSDGSFTNPRQEPILLKTRLSLDAAITYKEEIAPNVIGVLKGADTSLAAVVLSAHHDHDGKNKNIVYYGAVDNASGTVAMIEIAALFNKAAQAGFKPKRSIIFASFTGEERGLLGSSYYVQHPVYPMEKTYGVLNIDMMGRVDTFYSGRKADSMYAYILVKDSLHKFRESLYNANSVLNELKLDTRYEDPRFMRRRLQGSDQFPFYLKGIPFVRIDCGFSIDYHKPTDTPDKINYELLTKQTRLAFLTLWNMANE